MSPAMTASRPSGWACIAAAQYIVDRAANFYAARQPDTRSNVCQRKWIPWFHIPDKKLTSAASNRESEHSSHYLLVTYSASRPFIVASELRIGA
jgi:hypothetical protein